MSYVISDKGWLGSYMSIRERKAKNDGRKLNNEEIRDLNTPGVLLSDKMNKDEKKKGTCATYEGFCSRNFEQRAHLIDLGVNWRVILKCILKK